MPRQPTTAYAIHTRQQPFVAKRDGDAWHVTFPGYTAELDVHGSRIEADAIARVYFSLFLMPGAPFGCAGMDEADKLDLAEQEAAIEIEVQQARLNALLYGAGGDGALNSVAEPPASYTPKPDRKDRGDGRDARGRFIAGSETASVCGHLGFLAAVESIIIRYPDAVNAQGVHMARNFMGWVNAQTRV